MPTILSNYEALVIFNMQLDEAARNELIEKLKNILVSAGSDLRETALWGRRRLAYPIEKRNDGYYVIFYFQSEGSQAMFDQFERTCRFDENIVRHMIVKVPTRKKGQEIAQLVPAPGWKADFKLEPRAMGPRRREGGPRNYDRPNDASADDERSGAADQAAEENGSAENAPEGEDA